MYKILVLFHVIAATVWVGGHLILVTTILPEALKKKKPSIVLDFEKKYERIGVPALIILVVSGLFLAYNLLPDFSKWFTFDTHVAKHISIKLILLLSTFVFAVHARFRLIPNLTNKNLPLLALHIIAVTVISLFFVVTGLGFRLHYF